MDIDQPSTPIHRARQLWFLRISCFVQFFALGLLFSYQTVWMKEHGLGEFEIGRLLALSTGLVLVTGLVCGLLADVTGRPDRIAILGCAVCGLAIRYLTVCRGPAQFLVYAVLIGISRPMVWNMMPLMAVAAVEGGGAGRRYGLYRMFGSAGYAISTMILPWLIADMEYLLLIAAGSMLLAPMPLLYLRMAPPPRKAHGRMAAVLSKPQLLAFYVAAFFFALAGPAIYSFTTVYARELGAGTAFLGALTGSMGLISVAALPVAGWAADRFGTRRLILLALLAQPVRVLCLSFIHSYPLLLLPQVFHVFTFAGLEVAAVLFVTRLAGAANRGTAMSVYTSARVLAGIVASPMAGYVAERYGYPAMYRTSGALALIGFVAFAAVAFICRHDRSPDAPPEASA